MVFCHGVAYQNNADTKGILENILEVFNNPSLEIAVSREDQPLGKIGVYCTGTILKMWPFDCQSYVGDDGHRHSIMKGECTVEQWNMSTATCEAFLTDVQVAGIWFKESFLKSLPRTDVELIDSTLAKLNVPLEIVPEYYPVWH